MIQIIKVFIMQFSRLLSLPPSWIQIFSSAPGSQTPSFYVGFEVLTAEFTLRSFGLSYCVVLYLYINVLTSCLKVHVQNWSILKIS
jgi:hypothetical protein